MSHGLEHCITSGYGQQRSEEAERRQPGISLCAALLQQQFIIVVHQQPSWTAESTYMQSDEHHAGGNGPFPPPPGCVPVCRVLEVCAHQAPSAFPAEPLQLQPPSLLTFPFILNLVGFLLCPASLGPVRWRLPSACWLTFPGLRGSCLRWATCMGAQGYVQSHTTGTHRPGPASLVATDQDWSTTSPARPGGSQGNHDLSVPTARSSPQGGAAASGNVCMSTGA